jgi:isoamyl acetate esterase
MQRRVRFLKDVLCASLEMPTNGNSTMTKPPTMENDHTLPSASWARYADLLRRFPAVAETLTRINIQNLQAKATALRKGIPSHINTSSYAFGGVNLILEITFDDGVVWIGRIQLGRETVFPISSKADHALESEVVTLNLLKMKTTIPVPTVYGYDARYDNEIGAPYLLMEAMPGKRLWGTPRSDFIPEQHKAKVYVQIADILLQLYSLKFPAIGMLYWDCENDTTYTVGKIVDQCNRIPSYGPFDQSFDFYRTRAELLLEFHKLADSEQAEIKRAAFKIKAVPFIIDETMKSGPFYITHPDFQVLSLCGCAANM